MILEILMKSINRDETENELKSILQKKSLGKEYKSILQNIISTTGKQNCS